MLRNHNKNIFFLYLVIGLVSYILFRFLYTTREASLPLPFIILCISIVAVSLVLITLLVKERTHSQNTAKKLTELMEINQDLQKYNEMQEIMLQVSYAAMNVNTMDELLKLITDSAVKIIDKADTASILIRNPENLFEFKAAYGFELENLSHIKLSVEETFLKDFMNDTYNKAHIIEYPDFFNSQNMSLKNYQAMKDIDALKIKSTVSTPILVDNRIYGLINVDNIHHEGIFNEKDKVAMEYLASQFSMSIKNMLLLEKTLYLSRYDGLTNVYHRHYFDELFQNLYKRSLRYGDPFCVCMIDLDNLKQVNDVYGHAAGDAIIKSFAQILQQNIRETDLLGRYGGDEFILVLLNTNYDAFISKLELIHKIVNQTEIHYRDICFHITFSYGISCFPYDSKNDKELFRIADERMYKHKLLQKGLSQDQ